MKVAGAWNKTIDCPECGSWEAVWTSRFAGHDVEHSGDVSIWCRDCATVSDLLMMDVEEVRVSPGERNWKDRREVYHYGRMDWWDECPDDVMVHVGRKETSEWLYRIRESINEGYEDGSALYKLKVVGEMPSGLRYDKVDGWGEESCGYVNAYEFPGSVSLYLPKGQLELVEMSVLDSE